MRLKDYDSRDGKRVWLSEQEVQLLLQHADDRGEVTIAMQLMARAGLRRQEVVDVQFADAVDTDTGPVIRVWEGKGDKYRETPIARTLLTTIDNLRQFDDREPDAHVVQADPSTLYDWVRRARQRCRAETGDEAWQFVGPHDLRRSWGVRLLESGVLPSVVMEFGGWSDWSTFRNHYLAEFSPEALRRERGKVSWLAEGATREESGSTSGYAAVQPQGSRARNRSAEY
jgi:integrase